jgi:hypothetical protein
MFRGSLLYSLALFAVTACAAQSRDKPLATAPGAVEHAAAPQADDTVAAATTPLAPPNATSCGGPEDHGSCAAEEALTTAAESANAVLPALERVEHPGSVCMLSNRYLGARPGVPIDVAGHTYHGCCANCAARIGASAALRTAIDPISGESVDKANAVLARDASNRLYYFASESTFALARQRAH